MLIILNASVKNNIAIWIPHIHRGQEIIVKSVHYAMKITFTKAKLFAIRCEINYTIHLQNVIYIIIITDSISVTKQIFNISIHLYQLYSIAISKNLRSFFNKNPNNLIVFWDCSNISII